MMMEEPSRREVWRMFDRIAPKYDRVNRILSFGIDRSWRDRMACELPSRPRLRVLDLATGTGDQLLTFAGSPAVDMAEGVGMDLAEEMLDLGREKIDAADLSDCLVLETGDATKVPVEDDSFDATSISFGIRNVENMDEVLREMYRVLKVDGRTLILEFSMPPNPMVRGLHLFYLRHVLPRVGGWVSGDLAAYQYLNETIETFPCGESFCHRMREAGFVNVRAIPLTFGIVSLYRGDKFGEGSV